MINKKNSILVVDENLSLLFGEKTNHNLGGSTIQTFNWLFGFKEKCDVYIFSQYCKIKTNSDFKFVLYNKNNWLFKNPYTRVLYFYKLIKRIEPDIIYVSVAGINTFIWGIISTLLKAKYIQRISNNITFEKNYYRKKIGLHKYFLSKLGLSFSNLVLCQNQYQFDNLIKLKNKRSVIKIYNPIIDNYNINSELKRDYVAWIGLFQYQKNLRELYNIASNLKQIQFKIAGRAISKIDVETSEYIQKLNELPNVQFVGLLSRDKVLPFLNGAFCLLNTSRYEGFSNTFLEALIAGTPITTRKEIDPDNIIETYKLGIITNNYEELSEAIMNLKKFDSNFPKKAKDHIYKNHDPKHLVNKLFKQIENDKKANK